MKRTIDSRPARPLTSREISKIMTSILGGLVEWCGSAPVCESIDFLVEHRDGVKNDFKQIEIMMEEIKAHENV